MIAYKRKCKFSSRAKGIEFSSKYVVVLTGTKATIYDRDFNQLWSISKLDSVYHAEFSPYEDKLLLISTSNKFYVVDLKTFDIKKYVVGGKYVCNLEGQGCWSPDGESVYITVFDREILKTSLRSYCIDDGSYTDISVGLYRIVNIMLVNDLRKVLLIGYDMQRQFSNQPEDVILIWFDGYNFAYYFLSQHSDDVVFRTSYISRHNEIAVFGSKVSGIYSVEGHFKGYINSQSSDSIKVSPSNFIVGEENNILQKIKKVAESLGLDDTIISDTVNYYCLLNNGKCKCLATDTGLQIYNDNGLMYKIRIEFGAKRVVEFEPGAIAVNTFSGVEIYDIQYDQ